MRHNGGRLAFGPDVMLWATTGEDGTLYANEFGQDRWDELTVIQAGGDCGWPQVEGSGGQDGVIDPVRHWEPQRASPSGIAADVLLFSPFLSCGQEMRVESPFMVTVGPACFPGTCWVRDRFDSYDSVTSSDPGTAVPVMSSARTEFL